MKKLAIVAIASIAAAPAMAIDKCGQFASSTCAEVPEISALEGTAALAVVAAVVLLAWERRRRAI